MSRSSKNESFCVGQNHQGKLSTRLPLPGGSCGAGHSTSWTHQDPPAPPSCDWSPRQPRPPAEDSLHPWTRGVVIEARGISRLVVADASQAEGPSLGGSHHIPQEVVPQVTAQSHPRSSRQARPPPEGARGRDTAGTVHTHGGAATRGTCRTASDPGSLKALCTPGVIPPDDFGDSRSTRRRSPCLL